MERILTRRKTSCGTFPQPAFIVVVDFDSKRYALEGPIREIAPWDTEIEKIRRAGRDVWSTPVNLNSAKSSMRRLGNAGFEQWPSRSIVDPPSDSPASACVDEALIDLET